MVPSLDRILMVLYYNSGYLLAGYERHELKFGRILLHVLNQSATLTSAPSPNEVV